MVDAAAPFRQLTYHAALRMFTRVGESLGTDWTLHDLRHTAAYRMARDPEMPLADIQWILGHARLSTTQLYLTPVPDDVIASVIAFHARRAPPRRRPRSPAATGRTPCRSCSGRPCERHRPGRANVVVPVHPGLFRPLRPGGRAGDAAVPSQGMPRLVAGDRSGPGGSAGAADGPAVPARRPGRPAAARAYPRAGPGLARRAARRHVAGTLGGLRRRPGQSKAGARSPPRGFPQRAGHPRATVGAAAWEPGCS